MILSLLGLVALFLAIVAGTVFYFVNRSDNENKIKWTPLEAIVITISGYFVAQLAASILLIASNVAGVGLSSEDSFTVNFSISLLFYVLYGLLIVSFIRRRDTLLKNIGLVHPVSRDLFLAFAAFVVYLFASNIIAGLVGSYTPIDTNQEQQLGFDTTISGIKLAGAFISLVIVAPFVEEVVTRGFLYSGLRTKLSFLPAAFVTSVIFGIAHLQLGSGNPPLWIAAIDTFILSLILVWLRERYKSLWPAISLHAIKNGLAFMLLFVLNIPGV